MRQKQGFDFFTSSPHPQKKGGYFAAEAAKRRNAATIRPSPTAPRGRFPYWGAGLPRLCVLSVSNAALRGLCADESGRIMGNNAYG